MLSLNIKHRLAALATAGALTALVVGGTGWLGMQSAQHHNHLLADSALAVRANMAADMNHEFTRSEILRAAQAAQANDSALLDDLAKSVAESTQEMIENLALAVSKAPSEKSLRLTKAAQPVAQSYKEAALAALAAMKKDPSAAAQAVVEFDKAFHATEDALVASGNAIERSAEVIVAKTHQATETATWRLGEAIASGLLAKSGGEKNDTNVPALPAEED